MAFIYFFFLKADMERILATTSDDAAYFFKITQNCTAGYGLSFDRLNPANGFHPLWLLCLLPFSYFKILPETFYRLCLILQLIPLFFSLLMLNKIHSPLFSKPVRLSMILLFLGLVLFRAINGRESALFVFILITCLYYG